MSAEYRRIHATRPRAVDAATSERPLANYLATAITQRPDVTAFVQDTGTAVSYRDFGDDVRRAAHLLQQSGVQRGEVVAVQAPNTIATLVWFWAAWELGAVLCPIVTIYREHELNFILDQAVPRALVTVEHYRHCNHMEMAGRVISQLGLGTRVLELEAFRHVAPTDVNGTAPTGSSPDEPALLLYTSGTTADPKGVIHTAATLIDEVDSIAALGRYDEDGSVFMGSPLTHVTGLLYGALMPVVCGGSSVLLDRWDARRAAELISNHECTLTVGATPFLRGLVDVYEKFDYAHLIDVFICGGADIPSTVIERAWQLGIRAVRTYGSTEMPTATMNDPYGNPDFVAVDEGYPIGAARVRVNAAPGAIGELEVRGPELFVGYLDATLNVAFTVDGYFRTGDLARITERGTLQIQGRVKDLINRGGEKFSARDIEELLLKNERIADVAVVGVPDASLGERACAFVVPSSSASDATLSVDELTRYVVSMGYPIQKAPEHVRVRASLPRTASGKVQKYVLRKEFSSQEN